MAGDSTRPRDATRWIETSQGVISYAQLAPLLAERVLRVQQRLEAGNYVALAVDLPPVDLVPAQTGEADYLAALRASDTGNLQPLIALWQRRLLGGA